MDAHTNLPYFQLQVQQVVQKQFVKLLFLHKMHSRFSFREIVLRLLLNCMQVMRK